MAGKYGEKQDGAVDGVLPPGPGMLSGWKTSRHS